MLWHCPPGLLHSERFPEIVRWNRGEWLDGSQTPVVEALHMNHVTKHTRAGHVSRQVKDNQIELVFEGGKVVVPPLIHNHAAIWDLLGRIPAEVRDDGVKRNVGPGGQPTPEEALMAFLNAQK